VAGAGAALSGAEDAASGGNGGARGRVCRCGSGRVDRPEFDALNDGLRLLRREGLEERCTRG
jgi:hypothetical protein